LSGCASPEDYVLRLPLDRDEQQLLLEQLVVGESWFLREPRSFEQLQELARRERQRPLRVLSCGCSGGEEPYSAVIALLEAGLPLGQLRVEAIDISAIALARAAAGVYGSHALRAMEQPQLLRHFLPEEHGAGPSARLQRRWRLRPEIRSAVRFHHGALLDQLARIEGEWHVVFCRNVMLYTDDQARLDLLMAITQRLAPQGVLVTAAAETLMVPSGRFRRLDGGHGAAFVPVPLPMATAMGPPPEERTEGPIAQRKSQEAPMAGGRATRQKSTSLQPAEHLERARCLAEQGHVEEAHAAARRCLYLDPSCEEALELSVRLARELGRHQEADRQSRRLQRHRHRTHP
jgi:chemotaxis protein methyltransferase WspC